MTREEIKAQHRVVGETIIDGHLAGCPVYAADYWQLGIDGAADEREGVVEPGEVAFVFHIDASDVERWPELAGTRKLRLVQSPDGHVHVFRENY